MPSIPKKQSKPKPIQMRSSSFQTAKGEDVKSSSAVPQSNVCKMCSSTEHYMSSCSRYQTPQGRRARCVELGLCAACSGARHNTENCPAKKYGLSKPCSFCKSKSHISSLCTAGAKAADKSKSKLSEESVPGPSVSGNHQTNWSVNSGRSKADYLLPTICLTFRKGSKSHQVRCLVDLGSQRSYVHSSVLTSLGIPLDSIPQFESSIKTFLGSGTRLVREVSLDVNINGSSFVSSDFLVDDQMDVSFCLQGLQAAMARISYDGHVLADKNYRGINTNEVSGIKVLLGTDILYRLRPFVFVNLFEGSAVQTAHGIIPFGPIASFLTPSQRKTVLSTGEDTETTVTTEKSSSPQSSKHRRYKKRRNRHRNSSM